MKRKLSQLLILVMLMSMSITNIWAEPSYNQGMESDIKVLDKRTIIETEIEDFDAVIIDEADLESLLDMSSDLRVPVFIETDNYHVESIYDSLDIEDSIKKIKVSEHKDLRLKGYLVSRDSEIHIEPWFIEKGIDDELFEEDIVKKFNKIKENPSNTSASLSEMAVLSEWPIADSYSTYITYTEAYVGISSYLYYNPSNPVNSTYVGGQDFIVEIEPRASSTYDYSVDYFYTRIDSLNGPVTRYSPTNTYNTTSITVSKPWGVSIEFDLGGTMDVTKSSGGVGQTYTRWKFDPNNLAAYDPMYSQVFIGFESTESTLEGNVRYDITLRKTEITTGSSSTRTVNYNTLLSGSGE
ncbi:MAG TPA: hypothetical protein VD757_01855 [Candidatus Nitrosocosmicus sp.]|nr:hypothetical protein [Candidatus Nitrosocosmicus sp.]